MSLPEFASEDTVARMLGVSGGLLRKLRAQRPDESPPFVQIGQRYLYPLSGPNGLETWIEQRTRGGGGITG